MLNMSYAAMKAVSAPVEETTHRIWAVASASCDVCWSYLLTISSTLEISFMSLKDL